MGMVDAGFRVDGDILVDFLNKFKLIFLVEAVEFFLFSGDRLRFDEVLKERTDFGFALLLLLDH